jgi:hypothetical protein
MKQATLLSLLLIFSATLTHAQRSPFRKGYTRLGIQTIGCSLDHSISPGDNILKGNTGAGIGFVLEKGHVFYFIPSSKARLINAGIDWTIFSITYNSSVKAWKDYSAVNSGLSADDFTAKLIGSISTKIGPVVSVNPVQDLVIDLRVQASLGAYFVGPMYEPLNNNEDYFYPYNDDADQTGFKKFTQYLSTTGIKPNIGLTARWRGIGLAADYSPGKVNMKYTEGNNNVETTGNAKVSLNSMQAKLSLTF